MSNSNSKPPKQEHHRAPLPNPTSQKKGVIIGLVIISKLVLKRANTNTKLLPHS